MTKINAYLMPHNACYAAGLASMPESEVVNVVTLWSGDTAGSDWLLVGEADVSINLLPRADVVVAKVAVLRAEQSRVRADAEMTSRRLEQQIQSLLAISYEAPDGE